MEPQSLLSDSGFLKSVLDIYANGSLVCVIYTKTHTYARQQMMICCMKCSTEGVNKPQSLFSGFGSYKSTLGIYAYASALNDELFASMPMAPQSVVYVQNTHVVA